jgi:dATP pyrophosphohydrolase
MARAPFQVLVYPYRNAHKNEREFTLFKRSDAGFWQAIAGGGEDNETPLEAARRETYEEAGIPVYSDFLQLQTVEPIPVTEFGDSHLWGETLYVVPQYCFGVWARDCPIILSHEHSEYAWLNYLAAYNLLKYDGNKTALWELNQRLRAWAREAKNDSQFRADV